MASTKIGGIFVNVTARADSFIKGMKQAESRTQKLGRAVSRVSKLVGGAFVAGTGAAAAGLVALTKAGLQSADNLAKTADKLGIATEKLAAYRLAGEQAGVANAAFDKGLELMLRNISDAADGVGEAQAAFKKLNLDPEALRTAGTANALKAISDSFKNVSNASDRAAISADIFGRSGVGLINLLKDGASNLEEFERVADAIGLSLSRVDAKKIENANDALNIAKKFFVGIGQQLAARIAPMITRIVQQTTDWAERTGAVQGLIGFIGEFTKRTLITVGHLADAFSAMWNVAKGGLLAFTSFFYESTRGILKAIQVVAEKIGLAFELPEFVDSFGDALQHETLASFKKAGDLFSGISDGTGTGGRIEAWIEETARLGESVAAAGIQIDSMRDSLSSAGEEGNKRFSDIRKIIDGIAERVATIGLNDRQKTLRKLFQAGAGPAQIFQAINLFNEEARKTKALELSNEIAKITEEFENLGKTNIDKTLEKLDKLGLSAEQRSNLRDMLEAIEESQKRLKKTTESASALSRGLGQSGIGALQDTTEAATFRFGLNVGNLISGTVQDKQLDQLEMIRESNDQIRDAIAAGGFRGGLLA